MPIPTPQLDDRTYASLVAEARSLIPKYFPDWTDHNPSDPGITVVELFAFLMETVLYQINRIPERSLENFVRLVGVRRLPEETMAETVLRALHALEPGYRAITAKEFESLAREADPAAIARVKALVRLASAPHVFPAEQFVQVIIVPHDPGNPAPEPAMELRQKVWEALRERCLITTRIEVLPPAYTPVRIEATVVRDANLPLRGGDVRHGVEERVRTFLDPVNGGIEGKGWEFGRSVFRSEVYQIMEDVKGVDHVRSLLLNGDEGAVEMKLSSSTSLARLVLLSITVVDG